MNANWIEQDGVLMWRINSRQLQSLIAIYIDRDDIAKITTANPEGWALAIKEQVREAVDKMLDNQDYGINVSKAQK